MDEERIDEEPVEEVNLMIDKMEDGRITKREFFVTLQEWGHCQRA